LIQIVVAPHHKVHRPANVPFHFLRELGDLVPIDAPNYEEVDVAISLIGDRGKRAKDECDTHLRHRSQSRAKLFGDLGLPAQDRAEIT
jgi:hypothetical protein